MKIVLIAALIVLALASKRPDPVNIPAISKVYNKPWYSGYLDLDNNSTHMHYIFFPSQNKAQSDPLLFWFNGGPGCSSLLGALYQHGPFLINDAFASIMNNKYGWNQKASVVYIQSPAQVGFSYMDGKAPVWNDDLVAKLNARTVRQFLTVWSEFKDTETYIAGQSYAGIYVPTLFYELHSTNSKDPVPVNLKGFAIGNGCTDPLECEFQNDYPVYLVEMERDLGIISQETYNNLQRLCSNKGRDLPDDCQALLDEVDNTIDGINIYDAFRPCYQNNQEGKYIKRSFKELRRLALRKKRSANEILTWAPPCVDSLGIDNLLLDKDNRKAMGIPDNVAEYSMCNAGDDFQYIRSLSGTYQIYKQLVPLNKYKITIYSGDSDPAVPYAGTITWINKLRRQLVLPTEEYWRPWYTTTANGKQNSGSVWTLANKFKLVTFKGIGHMAPQWNIEGGYRMINNLLHNEPL